MLACSGLRYDAARRLIGFEQEGRCVLENLFGTLKLSGTLLW